MAPPPRCCRIDDSVLIDAGLITLPDGRWFAIAAAHTTTGDYSKSVKWTALAACRIYLAISDDTHHQCDRPQDPDPR